MHESSSVRGRRTEEGTREQRIVLAAGVGLVLAQLGFRSWALLPSWFYLDDYKLLYDASTEPFGLNYLLAQYNSNLMPGGRLLAWLVVESGSLNWPVAASLILAIQALASFGALWAFLTLFGPRRGTLVPLALYLTSAMTLPVMMWWTAGVNQVPLQASFFWALGAWVVYLRERRPRWLLATVAAVAFGLFFYVKALLIFPVLAFLALAYFAHGGPWARLRGMVRAYRVAIVAGVATAGSYVVYYVTHVSAPFQDTSVGLVGRIADTMLGTAFMSAVVGGPWSWVALAPPNAFADPPEWSVRAAWVAVAMVMVAGYLLRRRTLRAWALVVGHLIACLALLVNSRGPVYGEIIGLEYRYLTDAACVAALAVGLVFLHLDGAVESSAPRDSPLLRSVPSGRWVIALILVVAIGGSVSSIRYARIWHEQNASDSYVHTLAAELDRVGRVDLVDGPVPDPVYAAIFAPDNALHRFTTLMSDEVNFPESTSRLGVVTEHGHIRAALIGPGVESEPGPEEGCGWRVTERGLTIPLTAEAFDWIWWMRIGYLYSDEAQVTVTAGSDSVEARLMPGLNSLYVRVEGTFDEIRIDGVKPGTVLCVDTIEVGPVEPGGPL